MAPSHRLVAVAAGIVAAAPVAAQKSVPATYAITNARIVPVSGPAIEKGTIVIRDGIIVAVGASAAVPADARTMDGTGLTVYPGLIDAYGTLGMATAAPAAGGAAATAGRGGRGGAAATGAAPSGAPNSNYGVGLQPEIRAVDELDPSEAAFDAAHAAGFTAALTSSGSGVFRGQSALINLQGEDVAAMVIKQGIAQHIGFTRGGGGRGGGGGGGYPGSLMGVFAQLRQELLDAQHYRDLKAAYEKNPRGVKRPDYDPSLEALQPVIAGKQPVVMQANTQREIERALDLAKEFSLKPIIAGGSEAPTMIARLKAENVPVLLSVNFPRAGAGGGGGFGGGGGGRGASPDDPEPLRLLRDRVEAPKGPNALAAAGVKFAIQSGGGFAEFLGNMRKAVDAGLPADLALKSVTTQPAELFGVSDRLGTIEVGKIANLTITRGDMFDPAGRVTQVFVDGRPIVVTAAAATGGGGGRGGRGGGGFDASGRWSVSVSVDGRDRAVTFELRQVGDRLYGVIQGSLGASEILEGQVDKDGSFSFTTLVSLGSSSIEAEFDGTIDQAGLHGQVAIEDHKTGAFSGSHSN